MIRALLAAFAVAAAAPAVTAADAPWGAPRGVVVYPPNRPIHTMAFRYVYVNGQRREAFIPYYAPVYPVVYPDAVRVPQPTTIGGYAGGYYPYPVMTVGPSYGSSYSPGR
jgi:hypothetical protein